MKKKKVLLFNAVPTNNGDAALVFSLYDLLEKKGYDVSIASNHYDLVAPIYGDKYNIVKELGKYNISKKIRFSSSFLRTLFTPLFFLLSKPFMQAKVLVACPGGYINSYYGFSKIVATLMMGKLLGKKTAIYSQSIGPLNNKDKRLMRLMYRFVDVVYARDEYSYQLLHHLLPSGKRYYRVEDAAFIIPFMPVDTENKKVAISVRAWKHDNRKKESFFKIIEQNICFLVSKGYTVDFISTCQGLNDYVDDSVIASEIYAILDPEIQNKVTVNSKYFTMSELQEKIAEYDCVIGTRLHMCILSMLKGKPCFNISYERKGKEAYKYLGLEDYSVDYNEKVSVVESRLISFFNNLDDIAEKIKIVMPEQNMKAENYFNQFLERMNMHKSM